jgi:hypothetical protein
MKFTYFLGLTALTVAVSAKPHNHAHAAHHLHKRATETKTAVVPGPTVVIYVLNGKEIPASQVESGLANGSLVFIDDETVSSVSEGAQFYVKPSSTSSSVVPPSSTAPVAAAVVPTTTAAAAVAPAATTAAAAPAAPATGATGVDAVFPDGQLSCSTFPSQYGAVPAPYLNMGGWIGLQYVTIAGQYVTRIVPGITGNTCTEGAMCSYACPPGYQKSQWPATQGSTGQSVGGIACTGGVLRLTNPGLSNKLCIPGAGGVQVRNTISQNVAICRTDYPGTESETVPTNVLPGATEPITNPIGEQYYLHQGSITSAQYYINPAGAPVSEACVWNVAGSNLGNWAPLNMGVGMRDGKTWLSMFQNAPTNTYGKLDYTIEMVGSEGAQMGGTCKYSHGVWSGTAATANGCTVGVTGGTVTYVISA